MKFQGFLPNTLKVLGRKCVQEVYGRIELLIYDLQSKCNTSCSTYQKKGIINLIPGISKVS